jgi:murein DD-endopeptidase MepM/ murein hydrolase activator NlpD
LTCDNARRLGLLAAASVMMAVAPATAFGDPPAQPSNGGASYAQPTPEPSDAPTTSTAAVPAVPGEDLGPGDRLLAGGPDRVTFAAVRAGDVVEAVRVSDGAVVRRWTVSTPATPVRWDGTVTGRPVATGRYVLRAATTTATAAQAGDGSFAVIDATFPIDGSYKFGTLATNGFGGGRGHQGNDIFARCGTPLVAARAGTVQAAKTEAAAGNYVVLQDADGSSYVYMHMRDAALVDVGESVLAGQVVGYVGETGRADGCHLHFERWASPGWYSGGRAVDPRADLKLWQSWTPKTAVSRTHVHSAR